MARGGLSLTECQEMLSAWRVQALQIDDEVLERLAMDFQYVAPLEIDGNDLLEVLTLPGKKIVASHSYPVGVSLDEAMDDLWLRSGMSSGISPFINGVLLTVTINPHLGSEKYSLISACNMRAKLQSLVLPSAIERFGFYEREDDVESVDMMMVVSVHHELGSALPVPRSLEHHFSKSPMTSA